MRMFAVVGFSYVAGLLAASFLGFYPSLVMAGAFFTALILTLLFVKGKNRVQYAAAALAVAAAFGMFSVQDALIRRNEALNGLTCTVKGTILSRRQTQAGKWRYEIQTSSVSCPEREALPQNVTFSVTMAEQEYTPHQQVCLTATLQTEYQTNNPFGRPQLSIRAVKYGVLEVTGMRRSLRWIMDSVQESMLSASAPYLDEQTAQVLKGVTFGGTEGFPRELAFLFRQGGILHVFSVSGFHLAVLAQALMTLLCAARVNKKAASVLVCVFTLLFMALVGFRYAVIRAGVMTILTYLAPLFGREADPLNSLGLAALLIALFDPASVYDTGFLLSFSATLGILLCARRVETWITLRLRLKNRLLRFCCGLFSVSLSAVLFTAPVMILAFPELSLVGLAANVLLYPFFFLLLCGGFVFYLLCIIPFLHFLCPFVGSALTVCVHIILDGISLLTTIPYSTLPLGYDFVPLWLTGTGIIAAFGVLLTQQKLRVTALCITSSVLLLLAGTGSSLAFNHNVVEVDVINSYNGTCILIRDRSTASAVILKGDRYLFSALSRELSGKGVKQLSAVAVLEDSQSASGCAADLVRSFPTGAAVYDKESVGMMSLSAACRQTGTTPVQLGVMDLLVSEQLTLSLGQDKASGSVSVVLQTPGSRIGIVQGFQELLRLDSASGGLSAGITSHGEELDLNILAAPIIINALPEQKTVYTSKDYYAPGQQTVTRLLIRGDAITVKAS